VIPAFSETARQATMSMQSVSANPSSGQALNFPPGKSYPGSCKHCGHQGLFLRAQGPHIALLCSACQRWQKWIRRSKAKRYRQAKSGNRSVTAFAPTYNKPVESAAPKPYKTAGEQVRADSVLCDSHKSCHERFEKIERELTVLVKAILNAGWLQGAQSPPLVNVDDNLVDRFVREVEE
jgi:hypothetical protein